jgi:hypothetical protein
VLRFERELTHKYPGDRKYGFEQRGNQTVRAYSRDFARDYHQRLNGQVERQMRLALRLVGAFWYTAWVDAGQPDLDKLPRKASEIEQQRLAREAAELQKAPAAIVVGTRNSEATGGLGKPKDQIQVDTLLATAHALFGSGLA